MTETDVLLAVVLAAMVVPGLGTAFLAYRSGRMRAALVVAGLLLAAGTILFAIGSSSPHSDPDSLVMVVVSLFLLMPAGLSALLGGVLGRILGRRRG